MLAIRLKRMGRKGQAQYRFIVQDSHRSPHGGKVIDYLGNYNPHTKELNVKKELAQKFIDNGAQPSDRVISLFKKEGVKLPDWITKSEDKKRETRNPEKLRKNQPKEEPKEEPVAEVAKEDAPAEPEAPAEEAVEEVPAETEVTEKAPAETPVEESSTEETSPKEEKEAEKAEEVKEEPDADKTEDKPAE
ncbi:MAG: 30S ribosomal protein S16 [bacterium]|nr:30S ribosomal protein S16 [bacterium]